eukprot:scaffold297_cov16-Tisochrysis_lutea.AAC.1
MVLVFKVQANVVTAGTAPWMAHISAIIAITFVFSSFMISFTITRAPLSREPCLKVVRGCVPRASEGSARPGSAAKIDRVTRYKQLQQGWSKDKYVAAGSECWKRVQ